MTKTWEETTAEIMTHCIDGDWLHARVAAEDAIHTGDYWWPEGEGIGTSDINHVAVSLYADGSLLHRLEDAHVVHVYRARKARIAALTAQTAPADRTTSPA